MSSIASILSIESSTEKAANAPCSRGSSAASFAYTDEHSLMSTPAPSENMERVLSEEAESAYAAVHSGRITPVSSASSTSTLPSAAAAAASAASAAADATRRRKVLTSRPPNSFILYRSDKLRELVQQYPELKQTQISKMCADNWKNETDEVKEFYRRKQQDAKTLFLTEQALEVERISGGSSDKGIIKRIQPTNTFIRYRTEMKKKLAAQFATMNQKDVSRACGLMWRSEPESVKMRYRQSYNKEKRDFERLCTTSALEPSKEALSALASVIESAKSSVSAAAAAASSTATFDKKRRLSETSFSAPVSPPQEHSASVTPLKEYESQLSTKRMRSHHTPSLSISSDSPVSSPAEISLPSCASLLSLADRSPNMHSSRPAPLAPLYSRRSPSAERSHASHFPVPYGSFEHQMNPHAGSYHKQMPPYGDHQQRRIYPQAPHSHRFSVSGGEYNGREHMHYGQQPHYHRQRQQPQAYMSPPAQAQSYHRYQLPPVDYPVHQ
ncbi:hypothetical protein GGI07_001271 [Coemansia sp. Benny D115]|nr:hypothetical protein GGI07_001271 [Coemansia sp. Benny D115]